MHELASQLRKSGSSPLPDALAFARAPIVIKVPHKTLAARALASACGRPATWDNVATTDAGIRWQAEDVAVTAFGRACRDFHEKRLIAQISTATTRWRCLKAKGP